MKYFKSTLFLSLVFWPMLVTAQSQYPETDPISTYPTGMYYQWWTTTSGLNWTYPYSTKLTINHGVDRNFEITTIDKEAKGLSSRQFSNSTGAWTSWRKLLVENESGYVGIGNPSPAYHLDILNASGKATLKIKGTTSNESWRARVLLDRTDDFRGAGVWIEASAGTENQWYSGVPYTGAGYTIGSHASQPEYKANSFFFINPTGDVGLGTSDPVEALQIGDRWTFHNGGSKVIGYNYDYTSEARRIVTGEASSVSFESNGNISFKTAAAGEAGSPITFTTALMINNNGDINWGVGSIFRRDQGGSIDLGSWGTP